MLNLELAAREAVTGRMRPEAADAIVRAVLRELAHPRNWPMDEIAALLEWRGIDNPRPRDVLCAFFTAVLLPASGASKRAALQTPSPEDTP